MRLRRAWYEMINHNHTWRTVRLLEEIVRVLCDVMMLQASQSLIYLSLFLSLIQIQTCL